MGELNKQFEEAFPIPAHWIEFDEKRNKYYCPYVADAKAQEYQAKWKVWQFQQSKIEQLEKEKKDVLSLIKQAEEGYYGFSKEGGDTDSLARDIKKSLRGEL